MKEKDKVKFPWDCFFPRFLSFIMFAISKSPQGYASAALQRAQLWKEAGCHFCELAMVEKGK